MGLATTSLRPHVAPRRHKNIVVCSDGTGNSAIKGRGTNVFKLFEAVDLNGHKTDPDLDAQLAIYDDGVGTESFKPLKLFGGALGWGLSKNVKQLYKELARIYDPGDRIFLFGFSRGAFTVRTLAGMIHHCGMLDATNLSSNGDLDDAVHDTYAAYRAGYDSVITSIVGSVLRWPDRKKAVERLHSDRTRHFHPDTHVNFIGVWDTVDAVGLPLTAMSSFFNRVIYQFKFNTQDLGDQETYACHALAIDDARVSFKPVLWCENNDADHARIDQVWFAGAHSNVGGGYPKQGMSLVALDWMLQQAARFGLRLQDADRALIRGHATVDDKLYDPRAGLGLFYRWAPRRIASLCYDNHVTCKVHLSVMERLAHGTDDYAPGNLPLNAKVVITPTGKDEDDVFAKDRAEAVQQVLDAARVEGRHLLQEGQASISMAHASYWLLIGSTLACLFAAVGVTLESEAPFPTLSVVLKSLWEVIANMITLDLGALYATFKAALSGPWRVVLLFAVAGFGTAWALANIADRTMMRTFSRFWHRYQRDLRMALKRTRELHSRGMGRP